MPIGRRLAVAYDWLLSPGCALCGERIAHRQSFCTGCEDSLPLLHSGCTICSSPLPHTDFPNICGECQQHSPSYSTVLAPFRYEAPIDRLIQGAKYSARFDWLDLLARRLSAHIRARATDVDVVVPMPLHRSRLRSRGYNQALELARPLAKSLQLPLSLKIERTRATPPQTAMPPGDRRRNVKDAFEARGEFTGLRVALVDDVITSGATAQAASECLRKAGAASVEVWVVARA